MIETSELTKRFNGKTVVENASLYLSKGESVGLLGPNGAGKSTTISMISSLMKPTSGDVQLNGESIVKYPQKKFATFLESFHKRLPFTKSCLLLRI